MLDELGVAAVELGEQPDAALGERLHGRVGGVRPPRPVLLELGEEPGPLLLDLLHALLAHRLSAAGQLLLDHPELLDRVSQPSA